MQKTIVVKGRLVGPKSVELNEPISNAQEEVEVIVRADQSTGGDLGGSVVSFLRRLPPGKRSREEIDRQIRQERDSWGA